MCVCVTETINNGCVFTHWGQVTHICITKLTIIGSDNGLLPGRCKAVIWTNDKILLIGPLGTNFNEILIEVYIFSFKKMHLKTSSRKWWPFCLGLNVLINYYISSWSAQRIPKCDAVSGVRMHTFHWVRIYWSVKHIHRPQKVYERFCLPWIRPLRYDYFNKSLSEICFALKGISCIVNGRKW